MSSTTTTSTTSTTTTTSTSNKNSPTFVDMSSLINSNNGTGKNDNNVGLSTSPKQPLSGSQQAAPKDNTPLPEVFSVKTVLFNDKKRNIVTQKQNGPCPLIAITNILSLRGCLELPEIPITYDDLVTRIGSYLLENIPQFKDGESQVDHEIKMNHSMNILPSLVNGLILDIKFTGIKDFDTSCDTNIFQLLNIDLVHGWLVDPQDVELMSIIGDMSYNQVIEKLYLHKNKTSNKNENASSSSPKDMKPVPSTPPPPYPGTNNISNNSNQFYDEFDPIPMKTSSTTTTTTTTTTSTPTPSSGKHVDKFGFPQDILTEEEDDSYSSGLSTDDIAVDMKIAQFLKDTSTQLSYHGLCELHSNLKEGELSVFFRNNHFATIYKSNGFLYLLITDEGYIHEPVVWERMSQINGDSEFLLSDFKPYQKIDPYSNFSNSPKVGDATVVPTEFMTDEEYAKYLQDQSNANPDTDRDFAVALQLQNQENQKGRKRSNTKHKEDKEKDGDKEKNGEKSSKCKLQ